jgi:hypothetical protein
MEWSETFDARFGGADFLGDSPAAVLNSTTYVPPSFGP